jgi:hypothetical protein
MTYNTHRDQFWASHLKTKHGAKAVSDPPATLKIKKNLLWNQEADVLLHPVLERSSSRENVLREI